MNPIAIFRRIDAWISRLEKALILGTFAALVLAETLAIAGRNLFGLSFTALMEASPALVLWLTLAGAAAAMGQDRHIRLELVLKKAGTRTRTIAARVTGIFALTVFLLLFVSSLRFVSNEIGLFGHKGVFAVIFPLFFSLAILRQVHRLFDPAFTPPSPQAPADRP